MSEKIGKFVIIKQLGNGVSGNVVAVKDPSNGDVYAVKSIFSGIDHSSVLKEVEVMLKFNDPFLLKYYFILPEGEITRIFMEYCENGDLEQYLKKNGFVIDEAKLLKIFAQVVKGVSILHENKVIHCDLKPQNILLDGEEVVKLADFGVSKFRNGTLTMIGGKINTTGTSVQGTHGFIPAEVILGAPQSVLSDVFAVGCTMYFVATGRLPFEAATPLAVPVKIVEGTFTPIGRTDLSAEVKDLIHRMLDKDPKKRPTIAELNAHPRLKAALPALPIARRPPPPSTLLGNRATANSAAGTGTGTGTGTGAGSGAAAGGSGGSGNADTGKCSVCGCERAADEPEMACTKGHVCCLVCLMRAAMAAVRAKESTVRCVHAQAGGGCDSSYAQAVLEEQLPHSLLVRLPPPPTETVAVHKFRLNPFGGCMYTVLDAYMPPRAHCAFTVEPPTKVIQELFGVPFLTEVLETEIRTAFLDVPITKDIWRWTIQTTYAPGFQSIFSLGVAPSDLLGQCDRSSLGTVDGTCSFVFRIHEGYYKSRLDGIKDNTDIPKLESPVPTGSMVTIEADINARSLCFFVNEKKIPRSISNFPFSTSTPLYFGVTGVLKPSFASVSFTRISAPTPSPVVCTFYECKPRK